MYGSSSTNVQIINWQSNVSFFTSFQMPSHTAWLILSLLSLKYWKLTPNRALMYSSARSSFLLRGAALMRYPRFLFVAPFGLRLVLQQATKSCASDAVPAIKVGHDLSNNQ